MTLRRKLLLSSALALALAALTPASAWASTTPAPGGDPAAKVVEQLPDGRTKVVQKLQTAPQFLAALGSAKAKNLKTGAVMDVYDPPLGGCDWQSGINGEVSSYYTDGILDEVEATWMGSVTCITTAPGQSLQHMSDYSVMIFDTHDTAEGTVDDCNYAPGNACTYVLSIGSYPCLGEVCAGVYSFKHYPTMLLPDGWVWVNWDTNNCTTLLGDQELYCRWYTNTVTVDPVY